MPPFSAAYLSDLWAAGSVPSQGRFILGLRPDLGGRGSTPSLLQFPQITAWLGRSLAPGLMKSWSCTRFMFIRIPLRVVPPLRRGAGGV